LLGGSLLIYPPRRRARLLGRVPISLGGSFQARARSYFEEMCEGRGL